MVQSYGSIGSTLNEDKLTEKVRTKAQPAMAFSQMSTPDITGDALGLGAGDTGSYVFAPDVDTQGGRISENSKMPSTGLTPVKSTYTVYEYGNSVPYTGKLADLSKIDVEDVHIVALRNDYQKAWNTDAHDVADDTYYKAVMHSVKASREFVVTGTATQTQNTDLDLANAGFVKQKAEEYNMPYWDGESYLAIISPASKENFESDSTLSTLLSRDSGRAALNGEFGRVKETRWCVDNHALEDSVSSTYKEWFLFGADAIVEELSVPIEIRKEDDDFKRSLRIAWYLIGVHHKPLNYSSHSQEHVIHVTSA